MTGRNVLTMVTAVVLAAGMLPAQRGQAAVPVTNNLMVHLDAEAIDSGDPNQVEHGRVKSWWDSYTGDGFNDNADQMDQDHQPKYQASVAAINNMPAVEFIGPGTKDDHLDISDRADLNPGTGGYTVFLVMKLDDITVDNAYLQKGNHGHPPHDFHDSLLMYQNAPRANRENDASECFPGTGRPANFNYLIEDADGVDTRQERIAANTDWNIHTLVLTGSHVNAHVNGDDSGVVWTAGQRCKDNGPYGATDSSEFDLRIGNNHPNGGDSSLDGWIAEILIYDADLNATGERQSVEQYLGTKYGISLPIGCDFDGGGCGLSDINLMMAQGNLVAGVSVSSGNQFDLDNDNDIDGDDITEWLSLTGTVNGYASPMLRGDTDNVGASSPTSRTVDITDFQNFLVGFTGAGSTWEVGNFNGDDVVDITDFSNHFLPNFSATGGGTYGAGQSIPEPSTVLLLGLGGALLAYAFGRESLAT